MSVWKTWTLQHLVWPAAAFAATMILVAAWGPKTFLASAGVPAMTLPDPACGEAERGGAFAHLGTIRDLITGPELRQRLAVREGGPSPAQFDRQFHLRRRVDSHVLYFEVEDGDPERARLWVRRWMDAGVALVSDTQARYLSDLADDRARGCAQAWIFQLVPNAPLAVEVREIQPSPLIAALAAAATAWLLGRLIARRRVAGGEGKR